MEEHCLHLPQFFLMAQNTIFTALLTIQSNQSNLTKLWTVPISTQAGIISLLSDTSDSSALFCVLTLLLYFMLPQTLISYLKWCTSASHSKIRQEKELQYNCWRIPSLHKYLPKKATLQTSHHSVRSLISGYSNQGFHLKQQKHAQCEGWRDGSVVKEHWLLLTKDLGSILSTYTVVHNHL